MAEELDLIIINSISTKSSSSRSSDLTKPTLLQKKETLQNWRIRNLKSANHWIDYHNNRLNRKSMIAYDTDRRNQNTIKYKNLEQVKKIKNRANTQIENQIVHSI